MMYGQRVYYQQLELVKTTVAINPDLSDEILSVK